MKIGEKLVDALNAQIGIEYTASIKYDAIGSYFTTEELPQLAKFFFKQSTEEREHAHKLIKFLLDRDGIVRIPPIPAPTHTFASCVDAVKHALEGEEYVTASIHRLYELALAEKDHATAITLQWFVTEQVEEEATVRQMLRVVERGKESGMLAVEEYLSDTTDDDK